MAEASVLPQSTSISQIVDGGLSVLPRSIRPITASTLLHTVSLSVLEVPQVPRRIASLSGVSLLDELAALPAGELSSFTTEHSAVVSKLLGNAPSARDVGTWWSTLEPTARQSMVASAPRLVGNLDGVPVSVRNAANRAWVSQTLASIKAGLTPSDGRTLAAASQQKEHMLSQVKAALHPTNGGPARSLLSIDADGQGKTSIVIGNLKTADYVTYMVPGMFFTVDGQVKDWTNDAADLYSQQVAWLNRLHPVAPGAKQKTVAVVAWMGYQTPDLTNIGSLDLAYKGRDALASAIEGMRAERVGNLPYTTIVAHSYGSTAALLMLNQYDFSVDALAIVGSPGSSVKSASDLHVRKGNVFVGVAAWDPVPTSSFFGDDPAAPTFGAKPMGVSGGTDPITGKELGGSVGHNDYFAKGSESIRNFAVIGIGRSDLVDSK